MPPETLKPVTSRPEIVKSQPGLCRELATTIGLSWYFPRDYVNLELIQSLDAVIFFKHPYREVKRCEAPRPGWVQLP